jgi:hypothetical protein
MGLSKLILVNGGTRTNRMSEQDDLIIGHMQIRTTSVKHQVFIVCIVIIKIFRYYERTCFKIPKPCCVSTTNPQSYQALQARITLLEAVLNTASK